MPTSRQRRKHKHHTPPAPGHTKAKAKTAVVIAIIGAIVGLAIAFFANNQSIIGMSAGTAIGAIVGYLFGNSLDKAAEKK